MICLNFKNKCKIVLICLAFLPLKAQNSGDNFLQTLETIYYNLNKTDLKNFSATIKSSVFEKEFDSYFAEKEISPLEVIWVKPDKYYYLKKPLPSLIDTSKSPLIDKKIMEMRQELGSIFINWQRFIAGNLATIIPEIYTIEEIDDKIIISFNTDENHEVRLHFGKNGICLKILTIDLEKEQTIYTYPAYTYLDNFWLCTGWRIQIEQKGDIVSGFVVSFKSRKVKGYFLPDRVILTVQTLEKKDLVFERIYDFKNVTVNRELQITN
jgi:hypothetical protein